MAKPRSSQSRGVLGRLEESSRTTKESTSQEVDGHDHRDEQEPNSTATPTALTATQKKNKKRRARKKKASANAVTLLEMSHLAPSNELSAPLYEFYGTDNGATVPRTGTHREDPKEHMQMPNATAPTAKSKTQTMVSHTNGGGIAAGRKREIARIFANGDEDLDGLPITDLDNVERREAWIHSLRAPWNGLLNRSIQATEILNLRKKFCEKLEHPETFALLVRQQGEDIAHAIRKELAVVVAATEERERVSAARKQFEDRGCDQRSTPASPEWIPNIELFHDVDSLEGSSKDIVYGYHRLGKDGMWEWKPPSPPSEQTEQQAGVAGVVSTDDLSSPTRSSISAVHDSNDAHEPTRHCGPRNRMSIDASTHRLDSSSFSKPSPTTTIKQTYSKIPAPLNCLGSKRKDGARQSGPDSMRDVQDMVFPKASSLAGVEKSTRSADMCAQATDARGIATTMPTKDPRDVTESMPETSGKGETRSEAERARLEAELDALIEGWKPVKPVTQRPMPGSAEMAQIVEDIFEPLRRRCTATMNEHRKWFDDWKAERDAERVEDPDPSFTYSTAIETVLAEARAMLAAKTVLESAAGGLGAKGKERAQSREKPQGSAALEYESETFHQQLEAVSENHKTEIERHTPVRVTLLSMAKTEGEKEAGELAAAERECYRAESGDNEAEYVHPYVDRSYPVVRPHPEQRILAMEKKGLESLIGRICRVGSLKRPADARKANAVLSLAQSATQKSVAGKKAMEQVVSWE